MSQQPAAAIAFSIDSLKLGGAERTLLRWAVWCRDAGWRVVVITRHGPERDAYPVPEGVSRCQEPRLAPALERLGWWAFPFRLLALRSLLRQEAVGVAVGVAVGASVGVSVGASVGAAVGASVGPAVGASVGVYVGASEGAAVGAAVGTDVGLAVGASVGTAVGAGVGPAVGAAVGTGVGAGVSHLPVPRHMPLSQSPPPTQFRPAAHGWQLPPQSTSVSSPDFTPSIHRAVVGVGVVGRGVGCPVGSAEGRAEGVGDDDVGKGGGRRVRAAAREQLLHSLRRNTHFTAHGNGLVRTPGADVGRWVRNGACVARRS